MSLAVPRGDNCSDSSKQGTHSVLKQLSRTMTTNPPNSTHGTRTPHARNWNSNKQKQSRERTPGWKQSAIGQQVAPTTPPGWSAPNKRSFTRAQISGLETNLGFSSFVYTEDGSQILRLHVTSFLLNEWHDAGTQSRLKCEIKCKLHYKLCNE